MVSALEFELTRLLVIMFMAFVHGSFFALLSILVIHGGHIYECNFLERNQTIYARKKGAREEMNLWLFILGFPEDPVTRLVIIGLRLGENAWSSFESLASKLPVCMVYYDFWLRKNLEIMDSSFNAYSFAIFDYLLPCRAYFPSFLSFLSFILIRLLSYTPSRLKESPH